MGSRPTMNLIAETVFTVPRRNFLQVFLLTPKGGLLHMVGNGATISWGPNIPPIYPGFSKKCHYFRIEKTATIWLESPSWWWQWHRGRGRHLCLQWRRRNCSRQHHPTQNKARKTKKLPKLQQALCKPGPREHDGRKWYLFLSLYATIWGCIETPGIKRFPKKV